MSNTPSWINPSALVGIAALQLNIDQAFTLVVTPTQIVICRSDGEHYQCPTSELLSEVATHFTENNPAEADNPQMSDPILDSDPLSPSQFIFESPQPMEPTSPAPTSVSPPTPHSSALPTPAELAADINSAYSTSAPSVSIASGDTATYLQDLLAQLTREQGRKTRSQTKLLHLAYLMGQKQRSHAASFRRFTDRAFQKERTRRRFTTAVFRTHRIAQQVGLGRLLGSTILTFWHLKVMSKDDFEALILALPPETSDSEDFVFNEGAL
jgi:hypothetical protein